MNYHTEYNEYWRRPDRIGESSFVDGDALALDVIRACGRGRTLDIGCGMGVLVRALLGQGIDAFGLDVSDVAIEYAKRGVTSTRFDVGDILKLPYASESFDTIVSTDCLEHIDPSDLTIALAEMHRVCRRFLFLKVATTPDRDNRWHLAIQNRKVWEELLFAAGFRKSNRGPLLQSFESFECEPSSITLLFEKIPNNYHEVYPINLLLKQRGLHMDMLRESGRRSDAHLARYALACKYIRPGDVVLDSACGLGYGTSILAQNSFGRKFIGVDNSTYALDYANDCYSSPLTSFRKIDLPDLSEFASESVDVVISFETLEHLERPNELVEEIERVLTPGGRFICSVPNMWVDASGKDPNPHHYHVCDLPWLLDLVCGALDSEVVFSQVAGGGMVHNEASRAITQLPQVDLQLKTTKQTAEWWLLVAMKSPLSTALQSYSETIFPEGGTNPPHELNFASAYGNPWLVRSMVSVGLRATSPDLRRRIAEMTLRSAGRKLVDEGAALCVLLYTTMLRETQVAEDNEIGQTVSRVVSYLELTDANKEDPQILRWRISLQYALALHYQQSGDLNSALRLFECASQEDCNKYSPLLGTKTIGAAYMAARICLGRGDFIGVRVHCRRGLVIAMDIIKQGLEHSVLGLSPAPLFAWRELSQTFDSAQLCNGLLRMLGSGDSWSGYKEAEASYSPFQERQYLSAQLNEIHFNLQNSMCSFSRQIETVRSEKADLLSQIETVQSEKADLLSQIEAVQAEKCRFSSQVESLKDQLQHADMQCHHLKDEVNRRGYGLLVRSQEIATLYAQNQGLTEQHGELCHRHQALCDMYQGLFSSNQIFEKESISCRERIKRLESDTLHLRKIVKSASDWQRRSWFKRAFHKWRAK